MRRNVILIFYLIIFLLFIFIEWKSGMGCFVGGDNRGDCGTIFYQSDSEKAK